MEKIKLKSLNELNLCRNDYLEVLNLLEFKKRLKEAIKKGEWKI